MRKISVHEHQKRQPTLECNGLSRSWWTHQKWDMTVMVLLNDCGVVKHHCCSSKCKDRGVEIVVHYDFKCGKQLMQDLCTEWVEYWKLESSGATLGADTRWPIHTRLEVASSISFPLLSRNNLGPRTQIGTQAYSVIRCMVQPFSWENFPGASWIGWTVWFLYQQSCKWALLLQMID